MEQRVSAVLDESLLRRARRESLRQGKPLSRLLGEALELYLDEKNGPSSPGEGAVARSWAALTLQRETLEDLLAHEDDFLDA
jgi:hypothetical protein